MITTYQYALDFEDRKPQAPRRRPHYFFAALMFIAAYFTTITVQAQPQDAIALGQNDTASITGTVKEADENWVVITSAGKDIKVVLDKVNLSAESDTLFTPGMTVTANGRMSGDDFGVAIMKATDITASSPAVDTNTGVLVNQQ